MLTDVDFMIKTNKVVVFSKRYDEKQKSLVKLK